MAGKARPWLVDGRWTTVIETAAAMDLKPQQLYSLMNNKQCGLQAAVNLIRENQALNGQGRAARYMVDGRWLTIRQAAEALGVSWAAIYDWMHRHKAGLAEAMAAYREGRVKCGGKPAVRHRVGRRVLTRAEAARESGVTLSAFNLYTHKHQCSVAAAMRYYEKRKLKQAEKAILAILMEGRT